MAGPFLFLIIGGIAYIPGYMNAFLLSSLLLDRQPKYKNERPADPVTVLIAAFPPVSVLGYMQELF